MMKSIRRKTMFPMLFLLLVAFLQVPFIVNAVGSADLGPTVDGGGASRDTRVTGLVQCGVYAGDYCTFQDIIDLVLRLVKFAVFSLAIPGSIIAIMWAGIQLVWAQGNSSAWEAAKKNLSHILWGFAIIITAGLLVLTVLKALRVKTDFYIQGIENSSKAN